MPSYIIGIIEKKDQEKYGLYAAQGYQSIQGFDVEVKVAEPPETLEGKVPGTTLILMKFRDDADALRWYKSDLYQAAIPLRRAAADTAFMLHFIAN
jgi:uncharacterized protein (DUF1330 family)